MKNTIHIKESKKGTFTAAAKKRGLGVQSFASKVLANKEKYSSAMIKKANFARNASKWSHALGGSISLTPNEEATFQEWRKSLPKNLQADTPDYDLRAAWQGGLEPELIDGQWHLGSRNPETGQLLKSPNHPTYDKMITGEIQAGYTPSIDLKTGKMKSFNIGGEIQTIASLATKLGTVSPVLGAAGMATDLILTAVENSAKPNDTRNLFNNTNPYGLAMGGNIDMTRVNIEGGETISDSRKGQSLFIAKGPRHEQGGINIQANGGIVKSDRIGYDKNGRITIDEARVKDTFASVDKKVNKSLSGINDKIARSTQKLMLQKTENDNVAVTTLLDKIEEYKCGGKIRKMEIGGGIHPLVSKAIMDAYTNSQVDSSTKPVSPGYNILDPYLNPFGELLSTNPNPDTVFTPPSTTDLVGGEAMPPYEVSKKTKLPPKPKQPDIPYGEQMSMFGALSGGIYSAAQGLLSKAEKEKPRLINTQFQKNYYNPNEELRASKVGLNTALRGIGTGGVGNANRLAAAAGFMNQQSDIARRKFNYDTSIDQMASNFNLQRDSANAQIMAATDVANAQNRAQTRNLRRQGIGNLAQSIANVGDYKNRQLEQKMKIGLLDDIFANYGITADNIPNLMKMLMQGDFYKKPEENN